MDADMRTGVAASSYAAVIGPDWAGAPRDLLRRVFLSLPVDARLRCKEVCKPWCRIAKDPMLYAEVDLGSKSGVGTRSAALLLAVGTAAAGHLRKLDVSDWEGCDMTALCVAARLSARTLAAVFACGLTQAVPMMTKQGFPSMFGFAPLSFEDAECFLQFAPTCRFIEADIRSPAAEWDGDEIYEERCDFGEQMRRFLEKHDDPGRHYHRGGVVCLRTLHLRGAADNCDGNLYGDLRNGDVELDWPKFEAIARAHKTLTGLTFSVFYMEGFIPSVADICSLAIDCKLKRLEFDKYDLRHDDLPHLARVLSAGYVECFYATRYYRDEPDDDEDNTRDEELWNGPHTAGFIAALKVSRIKSYTLPPATMTREFGLAAIAAFEGHPSLEELNLGCCVFPLRQARRVGELELGMALTGLLSSGGALRSLNLGHSRSGMCDALAPLFSAVAESKTLQLMSCGEWGCILDIPPQIADHISAAVRKNTSLRSLTFPTPLLNKRLILKEAVELVASRAISRMITVPAPTYPRITEPTHDDDPAILRMLNSAAQELVAARDCVYGGSDELGADADEGV